MSMTEISAGSSYGYLTQHTAAQDQAVGRGGLAAYYEERDESPGMWVGGGLVGLDIEPGATVTENQMKALFAHGHHPMTSEALGVPFPQPPACSPLGAALAQHLAEHNEALGKPGCAPVSRAERAAARTAVAKEMFTAEHGRPPTEARELSSFIAVASRRHSDAIAGFDLTCSPVKSVSALWALAEPAMAARIEAAHRAAVADTMSWLESHAAYTRLGRNGIR